MMIIKLTEMRNGNEPYTVYVNMDHVQYFSKSINGADTRIKFNGEKVYLFVKETIAQIDELMSAPRMIVPADLEKQDIFPDYIRYGARK